MLSSPISSSGSKEEYIIANGIGQRTGSGERLGMDPLHELRERYLSEGKRSSLTS
jgi:hypothetical protein